MSKTGEVLREAAEGARDGLTALSERPGAKKAAKAFSGAVGAAGDVVAKIDVPGRARRVVEQAAPVVSEGVTGARAVGRRVGGFLKSAVSTVRENIHELTAPDTLDSTSK